MVYLAEILFYHQLVIEKYGGTSGIRDEAALKSAVERPYTTFDINDLYETLFHKSATILESIIKNHPFIDGNKRTALVALAATLLHYNYELVATEEEIYNKIIELASSTIEFNSLVKWIKQNSIEI
jgi:death on curing protein